MLKNEPRHDWQDASLALKITYGPSKNTTAQEKIEEKVAAVERKSNATERGSKQSEQMRSAPAVNPGSSSRDVRGDNRADTATKSRDELDREENSRKRSRFS